VQNVDCRPSTPPLSAFDLCSGTAICRPPARWMTIDTIPHPSDKFQSCRGASV
jgi:hypothetical protein